MFVLLFIATIGFTQTNKTIAPFAKRNTVSIELGGHGMLYSIGLEHALANTARFKTMARLNLAYYPPSTGYIEFWMPLTIAQVVSFGASHVEFGAGYTFVNEKSRTILGVEERSWDGLLTPSVYYRYQKPSGKIMLKAGFTPFFERYGQSYDFHPSGGVAIGYSF